MLANWSSAATLCSIVVMGLPGKSARRGNAHYATHVTAGYTTVSGMSPPFTTPKSLGQPSLLSPRGGGGKTFIKRKKKNKQASSCLSWEVPSVQGSCGSCCLPGPPHQLLLVTRVRASQHGLPLLGCGVGYMRGYLYFGACPCGVI